jgi:site-specific DNA-methyltransferase (adenine-specific)
MEPAVVVGGARVFQGDCREVLNALPDNSVDSIVTDPPYELGFMGKKWDNSGIAYDVTVWAECLRVLKPGGHLLAFGGSRTWHRLAVAVEDAGFEIRDNIAWIYGSGFPKSLDVSKAIDKRAGALQNEGVGFTVAGYSHNDKLLTTAPSRGYVPPAPATPAAEQWQGWGTALKPAHEPVVVGRKPFVGTVAENVLLWGVGGLNIDGSRIGYQSEQDKDKALAGDAFKRVDTTDKGWSRPWMDDPEKIAKLNADAKARAQAGRWPANVIFDEVTAGLLDEQSGVSKSPSSYVRNVAVEGKLYREGITPGAIGDVANGFGDAGGASRFFYVAKASKRDRNEGLEELEAKSAAEMTGRKEGSAGLVMKHVDGSDKANAYAGTTGSARQNFHPTVKPTALMRYLIKLVTPPGGTVLDPFTGSGSTGKAALLDGFQFVGIELTEEYLPIIEGRLRWANEKVDEDDTLF